MSDKYLEITIICIYFVNKYILKIVHNKKMAKKWSIWPQIKRIKSLYITTRF